MAPGATVRAVDTVSLRPLGGREAMSSGGSSGGWLRTQALALGGLGCRPCPGTCWLLAVWPWSSHIISGKLSFLICEMQFIMSTYVLRGVLYQQGA